VTRSYCGGWDEHLVLSVYDYGARIASIGCPPQGKTG